MAVCSREDVAKAFGEALLHPAGRGLAPRGARIKARQIETACFQRRPRHETVRAPAGRPRRRTARTVRRAEVAIFLTAARRQLRLLRLESDFGADLCQMRTVSVGRRLVADFGAEPRRYGILLHRLIETEQSAPIEADGRSVGIGVLRHLHTPH